jgi:LysM repeat protein
MYEYYEPEGFEYVIQPDDTLNDLADQYYLEEEEIQDANPEVDFDALYVGQVINIPEADFDFDEEDEQLEQQPLRPIGRPAAPRPGRRFPPRAVRRPPVYRGVRRPRRYPAFCANEYFVRPGDTLYRIASRFNISPREIADFNRHIDFNLPLQVGDVLCLPR